MLNYRGVLAGENFKAIGLAIGILFSVGLADLSAQDVSGTWILSVDLGASGAGNATFVFEQDGNELSGTYSGAVGEYRVSGVVEDGSVEFHFEVDQLGLVSYSGTMTGTEMEGRCEYGQLGSGTFKGSKQP